jgi:cytochrome c553
MAVAAAAAIAVAGGAAAAPAFEDTMAQRLLACTGCHGREGRAAPDGYYPRIAGKPARYLERQLRAFRDGQRRYEPMARLLAPLDGAYLREIASHFAALHVDYAPPARSIDDASPPARRARELVARGDPARGVPACSACHGRTLTGSEPDLPGLLGLSADYLNAQLGAWRTGSRHAAAPDCMAEIARRLEPQDVVALSHWLASQPVPLAPRGAAPATVPMRCGSLPATPVGAAAR